MRRLLGKKVSPEEQAKEWRRSINHEASACLICNAVDVFVAVSVRYSTNAKNNSDSIIYSSSTTVVSSSTQMNSQGVLGGVPSCVHARSFDCVLGGVFRGAGRGAKIILMCLLLIADHWCTSVQYYTV